MGWPPKSHLHWQGMPGSCLSVTLTACSVGVCHAAVLRPEAGRQCCPASGQRDLAGRGHAAGQGLRGEHNGASGCFQELPDLPRGGAAQVLPGLAPAAVPHLYLAPQLQHQHLDDELVAVYGGQVQWSVPAAGAGIHVQGQPSLLCRCCQLLQAWPITVLGQPVKDREA